MESLAWAFVVAIFALGQLAERRRHLANYRFLIALGAEELMPKLMREYYRLIWMLLPLAVIEVAVLSPPAFPGQSVVALSLMIGGAALRLASIQSLGRLWSLRCVVLPGSVIVKSGPYRLMRHPEYVSRTMDGVGLLLFGGATAVAAIFLIVSVAYAWRIAAVETRQISEVLGTDQGVQEMDNLPAEPVPLESRRRLG